MDWLGDVPALRNERHFDDRVMRCFAERPASVGAMLAEAVARNPNGDAVVCGARRLTYAELETAVATAAGALRALQVAPGDRVALLLANSAAFVIAFQAVVRIGAIAVPLNIREEAPELDYIIGHSGACVLLYSPQMVEKSSRLTTNSLRHTLSIADDWPRSDWPRRDLSGSDWPTSSAGTLVTPHVAAEADVAAILYTSGTTGRPKGAMLTHLGLVHAAMIYEACMGLGTGERSLIAVPMSHVTGLTAAICAMLRVAGALIVLPVFKADDFIRLAASERMTHTVMVPAMYNLALMCPLFAATDLSAWRIGGYGGAPMPEVTIRRLAELLPRLKLMNAYGSTETTGPVVLMPPAASVARRAEIGRAVPPCDLLIMDDAGREAAIGEAGEVWLRAPNVVRGYWHNAAATAASFVAGYWRSGDLGRVDAQGFLTLLDRAKDMINRGGYKIYSVEVENVLAAHPGVIEAAIVAKSCPVLGERVHAFIVARDPAIDLGNIRALCEGRLADYKIPETITLLTEPLPRNANGKVVKRDLRARLERIGP